MTPIITIAMQRSGTKFFGGSLNSGSFYRSRGEVFHPVSVEEFAITRYLERENLNLFGLDYNGFCSFFDGYFSYLQSLDESRGVHIDVMYNNLGALVPIWTYPGELSVPAFIQYAKSRGFPIVHIFRGNMLDAFISDAAASARGVFHTFKEGDVARDFEIELDLSKLKKTITSNMRTRDLVEHSLKGYKKSISLRYPDFIRENTVAIGEDVIDRVFGCAGEIFGASPFRKTTNKGKLLISNLDEAEAVYKEILEEHSVKRQKFGV